MDERDMRNARAWGEIYALLERWLPGRAKYWRGLTDAEIDAFCEAPASTVGPVMSRAMESGSIDAAVDAEIGRIMTELEPYDGMMGTHTRPMNDEMKGAFWFSVYRYVGPSSALTPTEAALRLGVTPTRVRAMIADGTLPATKVGGRWSILPADVDRIVAERG